METVLSFFMAVMFGVGMLAYFMVLRTSLFRLMSPADKVLFLLSGGVPFLVFFLVYIVLPLAKSI